MAEQMTLARPETHAQCVQRTRVVEFGFGSPPLVYAHPTDEEMAEFADNELMDPSGVQYFVPVRDDP